MGYELYGELAQEAAEPLGCAAIRCVSGLEAASLEGAEGIFQFSDRQFFRRSLHGKNTVTLILMVAMILERGRLQPPPFSLPDG